MSTGDKGERIPFRNIKSLNPETTGNQSDTSGWEEPRSAIESFRRRTAAAESEPALNPWRPVPDSLPESDEREELIEQQRQVIQELYRVGGEPLAVESVHRPGDLFRADQQPYYTPRSVEKGGTIGPTGKLKGWDE